VYTFSKLNISKEFRKALYKGYITDLYIARVLHLLRFLKALLKGDFSFKVHGINFKIKNGLLYYIPLFNTLRLYIPNVYIKDLLLIVYNK
jgi:hypothetical protein